MPKRGGARTTKSGSKEIAIQERLDEIALQASLLVPCEVDDATNGGGGRCTPSASKKRGRMAEKAEDELLLKQHELDLANEKSGNTAITQPRTLKNGVLRSYQIAGLRFLADLYHNGISGILADEMGLGKTVQAIAMIAYLAERKETAGGKSLVVAPKSVNGNWLKEFAKWLPSLRVINLIGDKDEREEKMKAVKSGKFDVVVTSFEIVSIEKSKLKQISWHYFVIDEAHRIKNEKSLLSQVVRELKSHSRLLLTGTPLQNNLHELWALLNFLMPQRFADAEEFDGLSSESAEVVTGRLQKILRPFMLRRLKSDVEAGLPDKTQVHLSVPLSVMQRKLYADVLRRDVDAINGQGGDRSRLLNIVMQLRKACNHPYLFEGQELGPPFVEGEHLIKNSAKLQVLDGLLARASKEGARVLVFSQMTRMLDVIEDYCVYRHHEYCRIDGNVSGAEREEQVDDFMQESSSKFVFLLSTRAGGLGLNLQKANWVVLFDSDWNPQVDIQAMDRAHRIGQTKQVKVFRLVTQNTVEERIVERAMKKLFLDAMVVQHGRLAEKQQTAGKDQLLEMIRFGADAVIKMDDLKSDMDLDIDALLEQGKIKTEALTKRLESMATGFSMSDTMRFDGEDCREGAAGNAARASGETVHGCAADFVLDVGKRARPVVSYNEDEAQRERNRRVRELEEEERQRKLESKQAEKDEGWTPNPKMKKTMSMDGDTSQIKGGKPGPADFLLRRLIEESRLQRGGGDAGVVDTFEFRDRDAYYQGRYDSDGSIVAEIDEGGEDEQRFQSLASWAFAIKQRTVSVKPVVFYNKKSLRQYEVEAAQAAVQLAGEWLGPSDPDGVVKFRQGLQTGVEQNLQVSPDEVQRIVRQEIEGKILKDLSAAVKASSRVEAAAAAGACGASSKALPRSPVTDTLIANICRTIYLASLYKDKEAGLKNLLKRAGIKDLSAWMVPVADAGQSEIPGQNFALEFPGGKFLAEDIGQDTGGQEACANKVIQSPLLVPPVGTCPGNAKSETGPEQAAVPPARSSLKAVKTTSAANKHKVETAAAAETSHLQESGAAPGRAGTDGKADGHWERTEAGARIWVCKVEVSHAVDKGAKTKRKRPAECEKDNQDLAEGETESPKKAAARRSNPCKAPQGEESEYARGCRGTRKHTEREDQAACPGEGQVTGATVECEESGTSMSAQHVSNELVGRVSIRKLFPKYGYFIGDIRSFDADSGLYTIEYHDGDKEELSLRGLAPYLPKEHSNLIRVALGTDAGSTGGRRPQGRGET